MTLPKISSTAKSAAYVLLLLAAIVPLLYRYLPSKVAADFVMDRITTLDNSPAAMTIGYACEDCIDPSVHGANVVEKLDGGLLATWFGGSREGGRDVVLWGSDFSSGSLSWSTPRRIVGPAETQTALGRYIKTVGNSVLVRGEQ